MTGLSENAIAMSEAFMAARRQARALAECPGQPLSGRAEAFAVQDYAISRWPHAIGGWKTGFVPPEHQAGFGSGFLAGPLFVNRIFKAAPGERVASPVFRDGFLSAEGE